MMAASRLDLAAGRADRSPDGFGALDPVERGFGSEQRVGGAVDFNGLLSSPSSQRAYRNGAGWGPRTKRPGNAPVATPSR
jgi:hypothetical protein